jgi:hypothetical protein
MNLLLLCIYGLLAFHLLTYPPTVEGGTKVREAIATSNSNSVNIDDPLLYLLHFFARDRWPCFFLSTFLFCLLISPLMIYKRSCKAKPNALLTSFFDPKGQTSKQEIEVAYTYGKKIGASRGFCLHSLHLDGLAIIVVASI